MVRIQLSKNFYLAEAACHDGTDVPDALRPNAERLAREVLQPIRDAWASILARWPGKSPAIVIVSWYRTAAHNRAVGGAKQSTHLDASGADIRPVSLADVPELYDLITGLYVDGHLPALGGIGKYRNWLHVDCRKAADGHLRRWTGGGIGSEK